MTLIDLTLQVSQADSNDLNFLNTPATRIGSEEELGSWPEHAELPKEEAAVVTD